MRDTLVLTFIGADRTGLVESLAHKIAAVGGNWEESRMARLAGQFAGILLVTVDSARTDELVGALRGLETTGLQVTARRTAAPDPAAGMSRLRLEVTAHDRPGIVRDVSRILAERGVNVEELESSVASAPMTGEPMFSAKMVVRVASPDELVELRRRLEAIAGELMVDLVS